MFWKWFWKILALLMVMAIFVGGGIAIYQAGYAQGVLTNLKVVEEGAPVVPYTGLSHRPIGLYRPFFPGLAMFLGFILILTLFGAIGRMARYSYWKSKGVPYPRYWGPGWHRVHHPHCREAGRDSGESPGKGAAEEQPTSTA